MERAGIYEINEVFAWAETDAEVNENTKQFNGKQVLSNLLNYKVFKLKGADCTCCPIKGLYFALERTPGPRLSVYNEWHFNLYGKNIRGHEVLLTKDHIVPRSAGGDDSMDNLQPMCIRCNTKKGSKSMEVFKLNRPYDILEDETVIKKLSSDVKSLYDLELTETDCHILIDNLKHRTEIFNFISNSLTYRSVNFNGMNLYFSCQSTSKFTFDALDPKNIQGLLRTVPNWVKNKKGALVIYDEILNTVKSEYKEFYNNKERYMYLSKCTYPKLMYLYRPNVIPFKLNPILWNHVKEKINVKTFVDRSN